MIFKKEDVYSTNLSIDVVKQKIAELLKQEKTVLNRLISKENKFSGEINGERFFLSPFLGTRQNFKVYIIGQITVNSGVTQINLTYTLKQELKIILYAVAIVNLLAFFLIKIMGVSFQFGPVKYGEYLILIGLFIMLLACYLVFHQQIKKYSSFFSNYLSLMR